MSTNLTSPLFCSIYNIIYAEIYNKVHISYYNRGDKDTIKYATNESGSWQTFTVADVGTVGPNLTGYNSLALDSNGKVHIAYHYCGKNEPSGCEDDDLRYVTNKSGTWQVFTIDTQGGTGIYPSIAIDGNGKVHISYFSYYSPSNCLKYATNKSGSWQICEVECSVSFDGVGTSIALDSNGKVHISYQDSDSLKYATNASGTWQIFSIDASSEDTGRYNSIAVDSNGYIHISYQDFESENLKYATNKTGSWETFAIDSEGRQGFYTSIAIDSDNYVHISYLGEGGIKYATNRPPE